MQVTGLLRRLMPGGALLVAALSMACAGPQAPDRPVPTQRAPEPCAPCDPIQKAMHLDDAMLIEKSKALFDAIDNNDTSTFLRMVGGSFELFEDARSYAPSVLVSQMSARLERGVKRSRQWKDIRTQLGPNVAVFTGLSVEQVPAEGGRTTDWEGWNTVVWVFDGVEWKAAHAQWQPGGLEAERAMWNEAYRKAISFKQAPNQLLVDTVKAAKPKRGLAALDIAMGQGRNAIFLAQQGYKVTGVDISDEGIRQAKEAAARARVKLTTVQADIETYELGVNKWDLITLIYAGDDVALVERVKSALKPGGMLVVEYFHADSATSTGIGGFGTGQLAAQFAGWTIVRDEVVTDTADWGLRRFALVRFVARKP